MEAQMSRRDATGCFDDQSRLRCGQPRHFEGELRAARTVCFSHEFMRFRGTLDARGNPGVRDGVAIFLGSNGKEESCPFPGEPAFRVDQLEQKNIRGCRPIRSARGCGRKLRFRRQGEIQLSFSNFGNDAAVLVVQTKFQRTFMGRVQREQIKIVVGEAVQHTPVEINGGINERVRGATIFGLDVIGNFANRHIRVMANEHRSSVRTRAKARSRDAGIFAPHLTEWRSNRYYNASPMSGSGLHTYAPLLLHLLIALVLTGALTAVSVLVGWRRPSRAKQQPYECGMEPTGDAREPFSVKFYLVAMVFILFDVEAIFLYPWAYIFRSLQWYGFVEIMVYIAILLVGYVYLWKKGALDWHK